MSSQVNLTNKNDKKIKTSGNKSINFDPYFENAF